MAHGEDDMNLEAGSPPPNKPEGYDKLGRLMGTVPETAIFRRFASLTAEDLLYRQAELTELEKDLRECQVKDKKSGRQYHLNWDTLRRSGDCDDATGDAEDIDKGHQWELIEEIRPKLEEYRMWKLLGFFGLLHTRRAN